MFAGDKMKKLKIFTITLLLIIGFMPINANAEDINVSAKAAVLMIADTGEILYQKNAYDKLSMASTTKIMTSLIALESGQRTRKVRVTREMVTVEGTSMGLKENDTVTVENLVYGMLLQSGNDAANVTATVLSDKTDFITKMNNKARQIGMKNTNFETPSGLDSENHYSCAYDMALLAAEALRNPEFRYICSKTQASISYGNPPYPRTLTNHNRLLRECEGCIGVKTGFTKKSGRCLVSAVERDGSLLVAVTLKAPNDWDDHKRLYEYGFSQITPEAISPALPDNGINVVGGTKSSVAVGFQNVPTITVRNPEKIEQKIYIEHFEYAPVKKGEIVGFVRYFYDGAIIEEVPIVTTEAVERSVGKEQNG